MREMRERFKVAVPDDNTRIELEHRALWWLKTDRQATIAWADVAETPEMARRRQTEKEQRTRTTKARGMGRRRGRSRGGGPGVG